MNPWGTIPEPSKKKNGENGFERVGSSSNKDEKVGTVRSPCSAKNDLVVLGGNGTNGREINSRIVHLQTDSSNDHKTVQHCHLPGAATRFASFIWSERGRRWKHLFQIPPAVFPSHFITLIPTVSRPVEPKRVHRIARFAHDIHGGKSLNDVIILIPFKTV